MVVITVGLTFQNSYHSNTDRGLSVAMATDDALRCGLPWFWDAEEEVFGTHERGCSHTLMMKRIGWCKIQEPSCDFYTLYFYPIVYLTLIHHHNVCVCLFCKHARGDFFLLCVRRACCYDTG